MLCSVQNESEKYDFVVMSGESNNLSITYEHLYLAQTYEVPKADSSPAVPSLHLQLMSPSLK